MERKIYIIVGAFCLEAFFANAGEISDNSLNVETEIAEDVAVAPETPAVPEVNIEAATTGEQGDIASTEVALAGNETTDLDVLSQSEEASASLGTTTSTTGNTLLGASQAANPSVSANTTKKAKSSLWDKVLKLFKIFDNKTRTCEQALEKMLKEKTVSVDFSNTSDFVQNGDAAMTSYYQTLVSTKSFGSNSPNLYVNLSKTGVTSEFIAKWAAEFQKAKKLVLWNLSDNATIDDSVLDVIPLTDTYSLNLSNTGVTDAAVAKITASLEASGVGHLVCVHLTGTKVTDAGVASLKAAFQNAVTALKASNPGKEYLLQGADESGVIFDKSPTLPKKRKATAQKSAQGLALGAAPTLQTAPAAPQMPAIDQSLALGSAVTSPGIDVESADAEAPMISAPEATDAIADIPLVADEATPAM